MIQIVGITGGSGSGKTTFTQKIRDKVGENLTVIHMDSYYHPNSDFIPRSEGEGPNFDHPDAFDWELLEEHLNKLKDGKSINKPTYDFKTSTRQEDTLLIEPSKVVLFEGIFCFYKPEVRALLDIKCFLHVDSDIRFTRRLHRDIQERARSLDSIINQYYQTVRPMYQKFLNPQKEHADFIVGEETDIASDILSAKIKEML